jgi:predicted RNA-binding Zn-ribbon protein involved in translation (DUF1610 family)
MTGPLLEVADLVRSAGAAFIERNRHWIRWTHIKVLLAIVRCRTAALGGHIDECTRCGHRATISYNSCRNRLLANRRRAKLLPLCFAALDSVPAQAAPETFTAQQLSPLPLCPNCGGPMVVIERLTAVQIQLRSPPILPTLAA